MSIAAVALLLAAAVAHATWNYVAKGARSDVPLVFAYAACATVVYLPLITGIVVFAQPSIASFGLLLMAITGVLNIAYFLLLGEGYRVGDLSLVYPLARGSGALLAVLGGIVFFGERPSGVALAGAALIISGIVAMSWTRREPSPERGRAVFFATCTGLCIAAYTLVDKRGVSLVTPVLYGYGIEVARCAMLAPLTVTTAARRSAVREALTTQTRAVVAVGVLSPAAYMLVLGALSIAPVSHVAPAREVSILFGALLGLRLLKEADPLRRLFGAGAIVAGVIFLAVG